MKCQYPGCGKKDPQYFICWEHERGIKGDKSCGYVCAQHDKLVGRKNLIKSGFSPDDAIQWETANRLK